MIKHIRIASDLHLEQYGGTPETALSKRFIPPDDRDAESLLVLAGDISSVGFQLTNFIATTERRFAHVIYVPGNHEFYGSEMYEWVEDTQKRFADSLINTSAAWMHFEEKIIEGVRFVYGTLWGDGGHSLSDLSKVGRGLRDFYVIRYNNPRIGVHRFTALHMQELHKEQKEELKEILETPFDGKTVVISHHLPSRRLVHPRFVPSDGSDGINGGFVGDCDDILAYDSAPALWIHGHTHDTSEDGKLWKTQIRCNPAGYYFEKDATHHRFQPMFFEIKDL